MFDREGKSCNIEGKGSNKLGTRYKAIERPRGPIPFSVSPSKHVLGKRRAAPGKTEGKRRRKSEKRSKGAVRGNETSETTGVKG